MNTGELTMLLARMSIVDGRDVDQMTLEAWEPLIGDLDYRDAVEGLNYAYRNMPRRPTPADIRVNAGTFRERREHEEKRAVERKRRESGLCKPHTWHYISLSDFQENGADAAEMSEPETCTSHHFDDKKKYCEYCGDPTPAAVGAGQL